MNESGISRRRLIGMIGAGVVVAGVAVPLGIRLLDEPADVDSELDLLGVSGDTFSPYIGDEFSVAGSGATGVTLIAVTPRGDRQFSLLFEGPQQAALGEAIHVLSHRRLGHMGLFMVRDDSGASVRYEAAFNHGGAR